MVQAASRKRQAPGTSSNIKQVQTLITDTVVAGKQSANQFLQWNRENTPPDPANYSDTSNSNFNPNLYPTMASQTIYQEPSNQLTRRPLSQQIITRNGYNNSGNELWPEMLSPTRAQPSADSWDDEKLDQQATAAMNAAKTSRKSIPPFVQKLSSFLDESRNTDLIRWSDKGDSFVVLDEDEFARTLIPELFKHNNYASFVRQLNMYGFHKKVGLSDNSMRASERKNKTPSEYSNPYFRRGRPNLLWLIQKPKPQGKGKNAKAKVGENGDEEDYEGDTGSVIQDQDDSGQGLRNPRQPLMIAQGERALAKEELSVVHHELQAIRQQQQVISGVIQKIRQEHDQLYQQAAAFQELHNRHENSINAILTFLATIYNRSLDGNQGMANLFANAMPHDLQTQGSVVDVGDFASPGVDSPSAPARRPSRRQPLLLKAPGQGNESSSTRSTPRSNGAPRLQTHTSSSAWPQNRRSTQQNHGSVEEIYDPEPSSGSTSSPNFSAKSPGTEGLPERDIMSFINSTNTKDHNTFINGMDFPQALSHLQTADGQSPLSNSQRANVLQLMAQGNGQGGTNGNNNALTSPNPPPVPNLEHWNATNNDLNFLEKTLKEQDNKVANLSSMLQPLSPSGSIPGLNDSQNYVPPPGDSLDFDQIFNTGEYFGTGPPDFGNGAMDFNSQGDFSFDTPLSGNTQEGFNTGSKDDQDGTIEAVDSSEATTPATLMEDATLQEEPATHNPRKRRRRE